LRKVLQGKNEKQDQEIIQKNIGKIIEGHALEVLKQFPAESVDCIITSPPYFNARDYETRPVKFGDGWIGQLGLEKTMKQYVSHLCDIFDECKRVLKKFGTLFVNIGDVPSSGATMTMQERIAKESGNKTKLASKKKRPKPKTKLHKKSLLGIPFRFAIEMLNREWILRNTIIWYKPNASPSSSKTKFTTDFEFIFFFVRHGDHFFEQQFEPVAQSTIQRMKYHWSRPQTKASQHQELSGLNRDIPFSEAINPEGRNKRCVWTIATAQCKEIHFAVFPTKLVEPMILAGCKKQGIVLDIFAGTGTTLRVAKSLGRKGIGIELNPEYIEFAERLNSSWKKHLTINPEEHANLAILMGLSRVNTDNLKEQKGD